MTASLARNPLVDLTRNCLDPASTGSSVIVAPDEWPVCFLEKVELQASTTTWPTKTKMVTIDTKRVQLTIVRSPASIGAGL
eukprot:CAMPEP_0178467090 /NCGR_PEP_ID=MMETSP0689_2-20121128/52237_1 /TAXON_ID=160604 /ORGANISM="Amphidinium massartii, Strain CS-259" /LENGTH=80 /DNA_ID=CAMNT_0020094129 /DNA_START=328 /DNA_END=570 /DNA_ORIENTATION=-